MTPEQVVWYTREGEVVCRVCREDLLQVGTPLRMATVRAPLECDYCRQPIGGALAEPPRADAHPGAA